MGAFTVYKAKCKDSFSKVFFNVTYRVVTIKISHPAD
jgi:RecA/RadA recombinase